MSQSDEIYQDRILEHFEEPFHRGHCPQATHAHEDDNPLCGDVVRMELAIAPAGKIEDAWFVGEGCCISQASASLLTEWTCGRTVDEIRDFAAEQMLDLFGVPADTQPAEMLLASLAGFAIGHLFAAGRPARRRPKGTVMTASASQTGGTPSGAKPTAADPFDLSRLRADFPILATRLHGDVPLVYFDNAATTQRPRQVIQSLVDVYEKQYANVHRGIHWLSDQSTDLFEDARRKVQAFIGAKAREEVIFTHGTTESINLVARSWGDANLRAGDEVLLTEMEHHANIVPWQQLAARTGAVLRYAPIDDRGELILDEFDKLLGERTKLVAVAAVSNVLGTINPIGEIIRRAHAAGAIVLVDAAQSVPHAAVDVQALGADFLAFSGHKMMGPTGVGVLYGRRELLEAMPPFLGGGSMIRRVRLDGFEPADLPDKFEAGTPPIVPAIGLGAAINYLGQVGMEAIHAQEQLLTRRAHEVVGAVGGVRFLGPAPEKKGGIVSFVLERIHAHDVAQLLDRHGIAVRAGHHCAMPLHKRLGIQASARISFYFYNTLEEVDRLAVAFDEMIRLFRRK